MQARLRKAGFCAVNTPTAAENAIRALVEDARARVVLALHSSSHHPRRRVRAVHSTKLRQKPS